MSGFVPSDQPGRIEAVALRYILNGKDGLMSLGVSPDVSLAKARKDR